MSFYAKTVAITANRKIIRIGAALIEKCVRLQEEAEAHVRLVFGIELPDIILILKKKISVQ